jgi:AcrR family transcriptional regulator
MKVLTRSGLTGWTIEAVAAEAGCAKGLVNYHFGSKTALRDETRLDLEQARARERVAAVRGRDGAEALDALWQALVAEVASGRYQAWLSLVATPPAGQGPTPGDSAPATELVECLARALGTAASALPPRAALLAVLDGLQLQLLLRVPPGTVEEAYHRLWLGLLPA